MDVDRKTIEALCGKFGDHAGPEDIYFSFRLLLGRDPQPEEIDGHLEIGVGQALSNIVAQYLNSHECQNRGLSQPQDGAFELVDKGSYRVYVDPDDRAVGRHVVGSVYEPHVTSIFNRYVRKNDVVVDIGANMGVFTALACWLVGENGRVISVEPNSKNCAFIEATKRENEFGWQRTYCVAATQEDTILSLYSAFSNGSVSKPVDEVSALLQSKTVQGCVLDKLLDLDKLDFVKIDVEGHELEALVGFRKHLERFKPIITSEFSGSGMEKPLDYLNFLTDLGYTISVIHEDGKLTSCGRDAERVMSEFEASGVDHIDILALNDASYR